MFKHLVQPKKLGVEGKISSHGNYTAAKSGLKCQHLRCGSDIRLTLTGSIVGTPMAVI
jgi:hypothetical protein